MHRRRRGDSSEWSLATQWRGGGGAVAIVVLLLCFIHGCLSVPILLADGEIAGDNETTTEAAIADQDTCAVDVLFVLDGSSSVRDDFEAMRAMVLNISSLLNVGPYAHRVALLEFSGPTRTWPRFPFGFAQTTDEFVETIRRIPYIQGTTLVGKALRETIDMLEARRRDVQTVVLVITDGFSQDDVIEASTLIHQMDGVVMFALEIPEAYNRDTLIQIAGNNSRIIVRPNILEKARDLLAPWLNCLLPVVKAVTHVVTRTTTTATTTTTTTTVPPTTTPFNSGCEMDLILVVDSSSSVVDQFGKYRELAAEIIQSLNIGEYFTRVALVQYASKWRVQVVFHLNTYFTKRQLLDVTRNIYYTGGTTNTAAGLEQAVDELADASSGSRSGVARQVVVVFTDGFSQHDPRKAADQLRASGATVYVIAEELADIEPNFDELWAIAGDKQHVFLQSDLAKVIARVSALSNADCRPLPVGVVRRPDPSDVDDESTKVPFH